MNRFATKQCTVGRVLSFTGIGVHNGKPSSLTIEPAAVDSGYAIRRKLDDDSYSATMPLHHNRVSRTYLCTAVDLGDAGTVSMIEHMVSALSGMGIDNVLITVEGNECPVLDGSAGKYVEAIVASGIETQPAEKKCLSKSNAALPCAQMMLLQHLSHIMAVRLM